MTYKAYHVLALILVRLAAVTIVAPGFEARRLGFVQGTWLPMMVWGIAVL